MAPVSVWRSVLAANQWSDIQTERQVDVPLLLLILVVFLESWDLKYLATPQPDVSNLDPGELNPALRFANTTMWWLILAVTYKLWRWGVQDRYLSEPPTELFVDLCTMMKVSVVILDDEYHGYYLHCRSPYQHADGSMLEISEQLKRESEGLTTDRGLGDGPPGVQTYEMFLSTSWRRQYLSIYRSHLAAQSNQRSAPLGGLGAMRRAQRGGAAAVSRIPPRQLLDASRELNRFLKSFVDQTIPDFPRELRAERTLVNRLGMPPEMAGRDVTVMFPDVGLVPRFASVMFYGVERHLLLMDILTFAVFDWWTGSAVAAALIVYIQDLALAALRDSLGKRNVSSKTLIDERFLI